MTIDPHPASRGLFSLALASRGLAPTHIRANQQARPTAAATTPLTTKLTALAAALLAALGFLAAPPGV